MEVRCPHCHTPIDLPAESPLSAITCPSCGSSFSLLGGEETASYEPETRTLGHFTLVGQIGAGSFGAVWRARDCELDRTVAVKVPRKGQLGPAEAELFLREARAAAQLRHPNIVSVYEVGREGDTVYIVSEYIEGVTLADWLTAKRMSVREAAALCAKLADALHHAHQAGVVHRDLKPGNILLDPQGEPHIMDFGLARRETGEVTMTIEGRVLGTPAYMSPEQAKGESHRADRRSDAYSLGVVLYELLTGERPFRGSARMLLHQIIHDDAPGPRKLAGNVPRDLETICLKCLEKDPDNRYPTAQALAEDLRRFLAGEPIQARPVTRMERAWRWCKRKPVVAGLSAAVLMLLLLIAAAMPIVAWRETVLRVKTEEELVERRRLLYISDMGRARSAWERGDLGQLQALLLRHVPRGNEADNRRFEWYYLWRLWRQELEVDRISHPVAATHTVMSLGMFDGDSKMVVSRGLRSEGVAGTILDVKRRQLLSSFTFREPWSPWPQYIAVSKKGLLAFPAADPTKVLLKDLGTGEERQPIWAGTAVRGMACSSDGRLLALACEDGCIKLWDLERRVFAGDLEGHTGPVQTVAFSPDDARLVSVGVDQTVRAWRIARREKLWEANCHSNSMISLAHSPDGKYIAVGSADSTVTVWDAAKGDLVRTLLRARDEVRTVAFSPDGRLLAAGCRDGRVYVWTTAGFAEHAVISGYNALWGLTFLPDGSLAFGRADGSVVVRSIPANCYLDILPCPHEAHPSPPAFSPDGVTLAAIAAGKRKEVRMWTLRTDVASALEPLVLQGEAGSLAFSPEGELAVGHRDSTMVELFNIGTGRAVRRFVASGSSPLARTVFSSTGKRMAAGCEDGRVIVWDTQSGVPLFDKLAHTECARHLCFCGGDTALFTGTDRDCAAALWDLESEARRDLAPYPVPFYAAAVSPDGSTLATGHWGLQHISLWRGPRWNVNDALRGHSLSVPCVSFLDEDFGVPTVTLASAGADRTVRLWDLSKCEERFLLELGHNVAWVGASPNGRLLAAWSNNAIHLFRAASAEEVEADPDWRRLCEDVEAR